jgi:guanyl-specific ribonuclease Sa
MDVDYYDPKHAGSFAGVDKFYRAQSDATRNEIREWLRGEEGYTLHKPVLYHFKRNKVVVSGIDAQWDADLMDMTQQPDDGYHYLLVAIDILSHYTWTSPLKNKTGRDVSDAFESIFAEGRVPSKIRTDRGKEFTNKSTQKTFRDHEVEHFLTNNEVKANYAERVIRTLKLRLKRYETWKQTHKWKDVIGDITTSYNNTYHRTIKRTPSSVTKENQAEVWMVQYGGPLTHKPDGAFKLNVGDYVRISHLRRTFQREYDERYTGEIFKVAARRVRGGLNIYSLKDFYDEDVEGTFYEPELQRITVDPDGVFKIDEIIRSRKRRGVEKEFLVKWRHWPSKFDSWVKASDLQDV